jgi:hypothetical protein
MFGVGPVLAAGVCVLGTKYILQLLCDVTPAMKAVLHQVERRLPEVSTPLKSRPTAWDLIKTLRDITLFIVN